MNDNDNNNNNSSNEQIKKEARKIISDKFFEQLKDKEFWLWNPHEHLLAFLQTEGKCCHTHCLGEPTKWGRPQPFM
jgi:hypothetical protein